VRADGAVVPVTCTIVLAGAQQHTRFRIMTFQDRGLEKARAPAPAVMKLRIAGKIQLIGLEDVRAALGARWPALAERAMTTAEHILRRRLDPADTASRTDDCGFAVCFANGDEEAASFRAATIQREIRQRLIGEGSSDEAARVTAIVASLPPPPEGEIDPLAIGKVLEERRGALEQRAREALATALREGKCLPEPLLSRGRRTGLVWLALPAAIRRRIAVAAGILGRDQIQDHEIDRLTFDFALEYVADFGLQGEQGPDNAGGFLVPVGFETLCAKRQADAYVERLRRVDAGLRARLVLMLGVEDEQVTRTRLRDVALLLRPFGVRLGLDLRTLQVPPLDPPPQPFGIVAVPATTLFAAMDTASDGTTRLVARLHARGARLLGRQARGRDEVDALTTLGVDLTTLAPTDG